MKKLHRKLLNVAVGALSVLGLGLNAYAANGPGVTDTEIKVGHLVPYSGPVSAYGTIGKTITAYFRMLNEEQGGINGRKVNMISLDDAYSPPRTVEQARRLVERDQVLLIFAPLGTGSNMAIRKYMNARKVPHLFLATGASRWGEDYKEFPWTMGWQPTYQAEGRAFAQHILKEHPNAKVGIIYQNDDFGKDNLKGVLDGLGDKVKTMVVSQQTYEVSDPTIDSQLVTLKGSGADILVNLTTPKFAALSLRKLAELDWKPVHYLSSVSSSVESVLRPAGFENAQGVITGKYLIDPLDPAYANDPGVQEYLAFMKKYYPDGDANDSLNAIGYSSSQTLAQVLKQAGDDLSRENVLRQATNLDMELPLLYKGIRIKTSPDDYFPVDNMQLVRFEKDRWEPFGEIFGH